MPEQENICKFSSAVEGDQDLFAYQFVYETQADRLSWPRAHAAFCCHLVTEGTAVFRTQEGSWSLQRGDLFFTFPSHSFSIDEQENFRYLYISFVGHKPATLLKGMDVTKEQPVHCGLEELESMWRGALTLCTSRNLSLMAKGVLLCTFACLQGVQQEAAADRQACEEIVAEIRSAVERDYADPALSMEAFSGRYRYNARYLSRRFRDIMGFSFIECLTASRIRHACVLLTESDMSVREVALSVGYQDSLYFSKVFKKKMAVSPARYRVKEAARKKWADGKKG